MWTRQLRHQLVVLAVMLLTSASEAVGATYANANANTVWRPARLRVDRLDARDALGVDTAQPLLSWIWECEDGDVAGALGAVPPADAVKVEVSLEPFDSRGISGGVVVVGGKVEVVNETSRQPSPSSSLSLLWSTAPTNLANGDENSDYYLPSVRYAGPPLPAATRVHWRVCVVNDIDGGDDGGGASVLTQQQQQQQQRSCTATSFVTGLPNLADWGGAEWIGGRQLRSPTVTLPADAVSAVVAVSGLGLYELFLNGQRVGDAVLDPGFSTNYTERILYVRLCVCVRTRVRA